MRERQIFVKRPCYDEWGLTHEYVLATRTPTMAEITNKKLQVTAAVGALSCCAPLSLARQVIQWDIREGASRFLTVLTPMAQVTAAARLQETLSRQTTPATRPGTGGLDGETPQISHRLPCTFDWQL